jgi:putative endonuclease
MVVFHSWSILSQTHPISAATIARLDGRLAPMNGDSTVQRGSAAEQLAAEYLQAQGVRILARNLRCRAGELDLVGLDDSVLAIVEVRQRGSADFGGAFGSVTWRKQRKIIRATRYFWQQHTEWRTHVMRFDVLALEGLPRGAHRMVWIKDAFRAT